MVSTFVRRRTTPQKSLFFVVLRALRVFVFKKPCASNRALAPGIAFQPRSGILQAFNNNWRRTVSNYVPPSESVNYEALPPKRSGLAIASMILGFVGLLPL